MNISIEIEGIDKVLRNFSKIEASLMNPREVLKEYALIFMPDIQEQFASGGREFGKAWPKLRPVTIVKKVKQGFPPIPLVKTGRMKGSFSYQVRTRSLAHMTPGYIPTGLLTVFNPTPYFKFHQLGTSRIPQRIMLRFDEVRQNLAISLYIGWIKRILRPYIK